MEWLAFGGIAWLTGLLLVPLKNWKKLWPLGIAGMIIVFTIDSTLVSLGAFKFSSSTPEISGIPVPYWLSYIPGGIIFGYYCPNERWLKLVYIAISAFALLVMELIMLWLGYFNYINWNPAKSFMLNAGGFTIMLWLAEWLGLAGKKDIAISEF
ncbi:MAG: hypothetical protein JL50_05120 [Peptococcaceae bacterium BICA1-7]|nr:MAG: hypothetical protein JL50_05120 [Peptococcaceae bacterium BICA1-7]HBV95998.1 DUF2878 domain-containing protein [Desulfotomaculum sp.]